MASFLMLFFRMCWFLSFGSALYLRSVPNEQLGEKVGDTIVMADHRAASDASKGGTEPTSQQSATLEILSGEEVLVNSELSKAIKRANSLAAHAAVAPDDLCERNWDYPCPDGWQRIGSFDCEAPKQYKGCRRLQSFEHATVMDKVKFASRCKSPWPCADICKDGRDYGKTCPSGWEDNGGGFCTAPADFTTKCATMYKFGDKTIAEKEELAITCGFDWPCKTLCPQDYGSACPEGWAEVPMNLGMCMAPETYAGDCVFSINTTEMSVDQKKAFAQKCSVQFPCLGGLNHGEAGSQRPAPRTNVIEDGPVDPESGRVITVSGSGPKMEGLRGKTSQESSTFSSRSANPSGPIDSSGQVIF